MINFNQIFTPEYYPYWISTGFLVLTIISLPIIYRKQKLWQKMKKHLFKDRANTLMTIFLLVFEIYWLLINAKKISDNILLISFSAFLYFAGLILIIRYFHTQLKSSYEKYFKTSIFNFTLAPLKDGILLIGLGMCLAFLNFDLSIAFVFLAVDVDRKERAYLNNWLEKNCIQGKHTYLDRPGTIFSIHNIKAIINIHFSKK